MHHEHQNPHGGIKWNKTALIEYYGGPPNNWTAKNIEFQVIFRYEHDQTNGIYDPDSIMHYSIEPELTINKCCGTKTNYDLSKGDKLAIQQLYKKFKPSRGKRIHSQKQQIECELCLYSVLKMNTCRLVLELLNQISHT